MQNKWKERLNSMVCQVRMRRKSLLVIVLTFLNQAFKLVMVQIININNEFGGLDYLNNLSIFSL